MDETYIKIKGEWKHLYRAVDKQGNTVDFLLTNGIFQITDITGRVVVIKDLSNRKQEEEIDIGGLAPGLYLCKVLENNILISAGKIIKN